MENTENNDYWSGDFCPIDPEYKLTNRENTLKPRRSLYYCYGCDANHVSSGEKCEVCGRIDYVNGNWKQRKRRFKK